MPMMASSSHQADDVVQRPCKASDNPHFFKVVLAGALKEQKLEIPKKFVREYGLKAFVNNQTCLKVADGREWNVGLTESNGRVWFHHGWQKFVEFYSVGLNYFLVFKFESKSWSFHVFIFDLTATEIEYPVKKIHLDVAKEKVKRETDFDDFDPDSYPQVGRFSFGAIKPMNGGRKPPSTASQRERALARATAFQSKTLNPSFLLKMSPSHIDPGNSLDVPRSFAEFHLEESTTEIILQVSDGRVWVGRCRCYWTRRMKRRAALRNGWKKFARDNNLRVGDACVFEMIRKISCTISFKVEIFRASFLDQPNELGN